jgi:hypothetical protein
MPESGGIRQAQAKGDIIFGGFVVGALCVIIVAGIAVMSGNVDIIGLVVAGVTILLGIIIAGYILSVL